jgi:anti-sigma-K factor RskA
MFSEHVHSLIAGYTLGDLDAEEAAEFEQLLAADPTIAAEVEKMQKTLEFTYAPAEVQPPAHLRAKILEASAQPDHQSASQPASRRPSRTIRWDRAIGAVAAGTIVVLGIGNYRLWNALQVARQTPQPAQQTLESFTYRLKTTAATRNAAGTVTVNPNTLEAVLTVENLPPLPPGKTYALWTVLKPNAPVTKDSKAAVLTKVFRVDAQGNASQPITVPEVYRSQSLIVKVAVTVENAAAPHNHVGSPILVATARQEGRTAVRPSLRRVHTFASTAARPPPQQHADQPFCR